MAVEEEKTTHNTQTHAKHTQASRRPGRAHVREMSTRAALSDAKAAAIAHKQRFVPSRIPEELWWWRWRAPRIDCDGDTKLATETSEGGKWNDVASERRPVYPCRSRGSEGAAPMLLTHRSGIRRKYLPFIIFLRQHFTASLVFKCDEYLDTSTLWSHRSAPGTPASSCLSVSSGFPLWMRLLWLLSKWIYLPNKSCLNKLQA